MREQAAALDVERASLMGTLTEVGPEAPTLVTGWNTGDLAAHLAMTEQMRGIPTFLGRTVVARYGIRLNDTFRPAMALQLHRFRRRGFDWALHRLARPSPRLLLRPVVLPVSVFEIFVHHEDARRANNLPSRRETPLDLLPSIHWILKYQQKLLEGYQLTIKLPQGPEINAGDGDYRLTVTGRPEEVLLWLSGRRDAAELTLTTEWGTPQPTALRHLTLSANGCDPDHRHVVLDAGRQHSSRLQRRWRLDPRPRTILTVRRPTPTCDGSGRASGPARWAAA